MRRKLPSVTAQETLLAVFHDLCVSKIALLHSVDDQIMRR
jgi:hypothetical protein